MKILENFSRNAVPDTDIQTKYGALESVFRVTAT